MKIQKTILMVVAQSEKVVITLLIKNNKNLAIVVECQSFCSRIKSI